MKNLYFTVNLTGTGNNTENAINSGFTWIIIHNGMQLSFTIITNGMDGISGSRVSESYILESFESWITSVINRSSNYHFSKRRIIRDVRRLINEWNDYMFGHSCNISGMNASVIILITTNRNYISFQAGKSILFCCTKRGVEVDNSDSTLLGRYSGCEILVNKGRISYGDTFVICSDNCMSDTTTWYIQKLIQKRRKYTLRHGRGLSSESILGSITEIFDRSNIRMGTVAVLCCERTE